MAFEKYIPARNRTKRPNKVKVVLWKTGDLKFTRGAVERFGLDNYRLAELFFDAETRRMGIVPTGTPGKGVMKLKRGRNGTTLRVSGLLRNQGIGVGQALELTPVWDKQGKMIIVRLKSLGKGTRKPRASSAGKKSA